MEMRSEAAADCNCFHKSALNMELKKYVTVLTDTRASRITSEGMYAFDKENKEIFLPADLIVCAAGMRSDHKLEEQLREMGVEFEVIGDAVRPGKVTQAMFDGYYRAKYL